MSSVSANTPEALRARRQRLGLSQQAVASLACCSVSAVRFLERGYAPETSAVRDRIDGVLRRLEGEPA